MAELVLKFQHFLRVSIEGRVLLGLIRRVRLGEPFFGQFSEFLIVAHGKVVI